MIREHTSDTVGDYIEHQLKQLKLEVDKDHDKPNAYQTLYEFQKFFE